MKRVEKHDFSPCTFPGWYFSARSIFLIIEAARRKSATVVARVHVAPPQKTPRPRTMQDAHWTTRPMVRPHRRRRSSYSSLSDAILRWRGIPSSSASSSCVGMPDRLAGMHGSCLHPQEQARLASHRRRSGSWPGSSRPACGRRRPGHLCGRTSAQGRLPPRRHLTPGARGTRC